MVFAGRSPDGISLADLPYATVSRGHPALTRSHFKNLAVLVSVPVRATAEAKVNTVYSDAVGSRHKGVAPDFPRKGVSSLNDLGGFVSPVDDLHFQFLSFVRQRELVVQER